MIKQIYGVGVTPVHGTTVHGCAKVDGVCVTAFFHCLKK